MSIVTDNPITPIEQITTLSSLDQIIETILVDDKKGSINVEKTIFESNAVKSINHKIDYTLKSTRLIIKYDDNFKKNIIISDIDSETIMNDKKICECVTRNTNNIISKELLKLKSTTITKCKFFTKSFIDKIFNIHSKDSILEKIKEISHNKSWIIISKAIYDSLIKEQIIDGSELKDLITNVGSIFNCHVYVNPDQKESRIYFGNYNSLTLIVKKQLSMDEINTHSTTYPKGTCMEVNYLLIENEPLCCLELY